MRRAPFVYDGLWRCLCPTVERNALREALTSSHRLLRPVARPTIRSETTAGGGAPLRTRQYGTEAAFASRRVWDTSQEEDHDWTEILTGEHPAVPTRPIQMRERLLAKNRPNDGTLRSSSVKEIIAALELLQTPDLHLHEYLEGHFRTMQLVNHLLQERNYAPTLFIYECMMAAMAYPDGSATGVRRILRDLPAQNLRPSATICHYALAALAIHPDYELRQQILGIMKEYWFPMNLSTRQNVVLGILRDQQYELAYLRLTELIREEVRVDLWVYDIFIMVFGRLGFLDEMLSLLHLRKDADEEDAMVPNLLYYTLDVCSQAYHHHGTTFAWLSAVKTSKLQPSDGITENVLATASRHGDVGLATEALEILSDRARVRDFHYEATAEAFVESGDIQGAVRIFCIMKRSGYTVGTENVTTFCQALSKDAQFVVAAETAMRSLYRDNDIPLALAGAVVAAKAEARGSEQAMILYRDIPLLCGAPPTPAMAQDMISHSSIPETRQELIQEYKTMVGDDAGEAPPLRTPRLYVALIPKLVDANELDLAFTLASQAASAAIPTQADAMPQLWIKPLVDAAVAREDGRIWALMDVLEERGDAAGVRAMRWALRHAKLRQRGS